MVKVAAQFIREWKGRHVFEAGLESKLRILDHAFDDLFDVADVQLETPAGRGMQMRNVVFCKNVDAMVDHCSGYRCLQCMCSC